MSNYCDESFYQQNLYTNTYSLWENSAYYDINNLSPQNVSSSWHRGNDEDFDTRYTSGPTEGQLTEPPDHRNRKVVEKSSLYQNPDSFYQDVIENTALPPTTELPPIHWQNSGPNPSKEGSSTGNKGKMGRPNKIQKKIDKMLTKPVKISKAESMMQKMGWQGGALGKSGTGILEPIAPTAVYATQKKGFGQTFEPKIKSKSKVQNKDHFTMNVLYHIYEFVKNNAQIELLFDKTLHNGERKRIHNIVGLMSNVDELSMVNFKSTAEMDMVLQIRDVNCYILQTQSEGERPNRQICIYKEAPQNVYLIIPDDLREDRLAVDPPADPPVEKSDSKDEVSDTEVDEETNPFLRSITRNLKKTKDVVKAQKMQPTEVPKEASILEKIIEFFTEFSEKNEYSQFKFLGPFTHEEADGIREFMEKAAQYLKNEECDVKEVFDKISFEIGEDVTGNKVINKISK